MQSEWFKRFTCACNAFHSKQFFFCIKLICGHRKLCNFIQKLWHNTKEFRYNFDDGEFEKLWHFIFMCGSLWAARLWLQTEKIPTISHWICASTPNTIWNKAKHIQRYFCLVFFFDRRNIVVVVNNKRTRKRKTIIYWGWRKTVLSATNPTIGNAQNKWKNILNKPMCKSYLHGICMWISGFFISYRLHVNTRSQIEAKPKQRIKKKQFPVFPEKKEEFFWEKNEKKL